MSSRCAVCRQPIGMERAGVRLTPLKAGIFDAIKRAGDLGVTSTEIVRSPLYRDRRPYRGRREFGDEGIKAHVWQINDLLENTPFVIVSDRRRWFLQRRRGA